MSYVPPADVAAHPSTTQVMSQGGFKAVTQAAGWQTLALNLQRDSALAGEVAAVYSCYLLPLELDLPWGFRPARNLDHLETRTQQRASMGPRLASYDAVAFAWQRALAALERALPWAGELAAAAAVLKQQQQDEQQQEAQQANPPAVGGDAAQNQQQQQQGMQCSQLVRSALLLLREAAVQPDSVLQQLQQHCIVPGLHAASQEACIGQFRRGYASRRKAKAAAAFAAAESEWWAEDEQAAMQLFAKDQAAVEVVAAAAAGAGKQGDAVASGRGKRRSSSPIEQVQQQPPNTAAAAGEDAAAATEAGAEPPAKRVCTVAAPNSSSQQQDHLQQQQQQSVAPDPQVQLDAAQWLLLSLRALLSGPPGCNRPQLQLSGVRLDPLSDSAAAAGNSVLRPSSGVDGSGSSSSSALTGKRAFHGVTPKCGACQTCSNPSMKKACIVNRQRIAQGLPPILPEAGAAAATAAAAKGKSK
jgi:hypothetical protein